MNGPRALRWLLAGVVALVAMLVAPAADANYSFRVPRMILTVDIQPDASVQLEYLITFDNRGQTIDIVDVGMPNEDYDIDDMRAWVGKDRVTGKIAPSTYIAGGVEVHLGPQSIYPANTTTFRFVAQAENLVFADTTDESLASFRITPTWFDGNLVSGTTDLTIKVVLPAGVTADSNVLHQGKAFTARRTESGRMVVVWDEKWSPTQAYLVGVSFPRASMDRVVVITQWDLFYAWWSESPGVRFVTLLAQLSIFGVCFFRFTSGTGWSLFVLFVIAMGILAAVSAMAQLVTIPLLLGFGIWLEVRLRRARKRYLPPVISIEGGGIKRGLTAPEAAALLERPLPEVLTLVVFGLLKKGLAQLSGTEPARVRTIEPLRAAFKEQRIKHAGHLGVVIHDYEHAFLDAFVDGDAPRESELGKAIEGLLAHTATRVTGHDLDQTREYYRQVVERAWKEAETIGPVEQRTEHVDGKLEWMWLADGATDRFDRLGGSSFRYTPPWTRSPIATSGSGSSSSDGGSPGLSVTPTFSDVASSVVGWAENAAGEVAAAVLPRGGVDLGGIDKAVGKALESSGSGGGGRSGGGCACACAGCACACACAGGGR